MAQLEKSAATGLSKLRRVWMVRLDRTAAAEAQALETGLVVFDAGVRADLSDHLEFADILEEVAEANPGESLRRQEASARQLHLLLHDIQAGDLAISPLRTSGRLAVGVFRGDTGVDRDGRPGRMVQWLRKDVPRNQLMHDLLYSLGAKQKVCEIARNDAARRIEAVLGGNADPGPEGAGGLLPDDPDELESLLRQRIMSRMGVVFSGHALADLIGEILKVRGYQVRVSPPGPDGGVDIYAGKGGLGGDSRLIVQVKSGDQTAGHETLQRLEGAMRAAKAEQGLLVSWGGFTRQVAARSDQLWYEVRMWSAADVMDEFVDCYDRLPLNIRDAMPLRKAWLA